MDLQCPNCEKPTEISAGQTLRCQCGELISGPDPPSGEMPQRETFLGHYRIVEELGRGGMGKVYKGIHETLRQVRAIKVLSRDESKKPKRVARFQREARIVAGLDHPNIVRMFEFSRDQKRGFYYFVMEYVNGGTVSEFIKRNGAIQWSEAVDIVLQIARGLNQMHSLNLVHRDIKPSNILIDHDATAKLADLGLARHEGDGEEVDLTATGVVLGTLDYMSPEQIVDSSRADIRSDLYSLGCTLFHMLTASLPFDAGSAYQKIQKHMHEPLPDVGPLAPDVPFPLALILNKLTAKEPAERYQTPRELIDSLEALVLAPESKSDGSAVVIPAFDFAAPQPKQKTEQPLPEAVPAKSLFQRIEELPFWARVLVGSAIGLFAALLVWFAAKGIFGGEDPSEPEIPIPITPRVNPYQDEEDQFLRKAREIFDDQPSDQPSDQPDAAADPPETEKSE